MNTGFNGEIRRYNQPNIIASNRALCSIHGVMLAYDAAGYAAGQVLSRNSISGLYQDYAPAGASGTDTAKAVLLEDVPAEDFLSSSDSCGAAGLFGGEVYKSKLLDLDADAVTDLAAKTVVVAGGTEILKF